MTAADLKKLQLDGFEIASHTYSHPDLTKLADAKVVKEVDASRQALLALGLTVDSFIYPYGAYNAAVIKRVKAAGYRVARATGAPTIAGGGYASVDPRRRFNLNCALPIKDTTAAKLSSYFSNRHRMELEDLYVVDRDAGKLSAIVRDWSYKKASGGIITMADVGDAVSVRFLVTRPGSYDLQFKVKTGVQGDDTASATGYAYTLDGKPLSYTTSGPYEVEGKYVVWGRQLVSGVKLTPGWKTLIIMVTKDWSGLVDWLEIRRK